MTINMEVKKDALRQTQDGLWKLTLTVLPEDMPVDLMVAPMGSRYAMAIVPIRDNEVANPVIQENRVTEQTEGEKLRTRAVLLCKDARFQVFIERYSNSKMAASVLSGEERAAEIMRDLLCIESRSKIATDIEAQTSFKHLLCQYEAYNTEEQYADNLNRY